MTMDCERYAKDIAARLIGPDDALHCDRRHLELVLATAYEQGRMDGADQIMPLATAMLSALHDAYFHASRIKGRADAKRIACETGRVLRWWNGY